MKADMFCNTCRVAYTVRGTMFDTTNDQCDEDCDSEVELSADYCPFCGQLAEED